MHIARAHSENKECTGADVVYQNRNEQKKKDEKRWNIEERCLRMQTKRLLFSAKLPIKMSLIQSLWNNTGANHPGTFTSFFLYDMSTFFTVRYVWELIWHFYIVILNFKCRHVIMATAMCDEHRMGWNSWMTMDLWHINGNGSSLIWHVDCLPIVDNCLMGKMFDRS